MMSINMIFSLFFICAALIPLQPTFGTVVEVRENGILGVPESTDRELVQNFLDNREEIKQWLMSQTERRSTRVPSLGCSGCRIAISLALNLIHQGVSEESLATSITNLCVTLNVVPAAVCRGVVDLYIPQAAFIIQEKSFLKTNDICATLIQDSECGSVNASLIGWTVSIDSNKPKVVTPPLLPANISTVKILQLTDIHLDLDYQVGSSAECKEPLCCREELTDNSSLAAGVFGSYECDFPEPAMINLFEDSATRYDEYGFVLLTGDFMNHAIWATSVSDNMRHNHAVAQPLLKLFNGTRIYPVLGNHEPHPCNMYAPQAVWDKFDLSWLYDDIANLYSESLPADALASFRKAGYYTVTPYKDLRLVVLNSNLCYTLNFWLLYNLDNDPEGQLQWFANVMDAAEKANEQVYVVSHVPPGHYQCFSHWNVEFNRIINRYEAIIKAQFYGHTHEDDLKIFFDESEDPPRPTSSLYIGASTTTYTNLNPGYKVYAVDGVGEPGRNRTWEIKEHETFISNLTASNLEGGKPEFYQLYSAREAYNLTSLRPSDLYSFVVKMVNDENLFQTFYTHFNKASDTMEPCVDSKCRLGYLCDIVTTDIKNPVHCDRIKALLEE